MTTESSHWIISSICAYEEQDIVPNVIKGACRQLLLAVRATELRDRVKL